MTTKDQLTLAAKSAAEEITESMLDSLTSELSFEEIITKHFTPLVQRLELAHKALDAIDAITSDDFCGDLEMSTLDGQLKTAAEKLSLCYRIAHSESPNHTCHHVHETWRELKDQILTKQSPSQ